MATIPSGQKFHTVSANVDTADRGSALVDADREVYTMQDIIDTTAGGGGGVTGEDFSVVVREDPYASAGDHEGTVLTIGSVATLGEAYYWNGSAWALANAGAVATATGLLCLGTAAAGDALVEGIMQLTSAPGSAGDVLYLDTTNGLLTHDVSGFAAGQIVRVCGHNLGSNRVYFNPSADWIELA